MGETLHGLCSLELTVPVRRRWRGAVKGALFSRLFLTSYLTMLYLKNSKLHFFLRDMSIWPG